MTKTTIDHSTIIEQKLTRSEAIELALETIQVKLRARTSELEAELQRTLEPTEEDKRKLIETLTFGVQISYSPENCRPVVHSHSLKLEHDDPRYAEVVRLRNELNAVSQLAYELSDARKAKNAVLRHLLDGTTHGRTLLEAIDDFASKIVVQRKLLTT